MQKKQRIVIIGGGFGGAALTRALQKRADRFDVTLLSEESYTTFNPMLAEVVGATVFPEHVIAPLRETVGKARFVMARVIGIDFTAKRVHCATLKGDTHLDYDQIVLAYGNRARIDLIPGMSEHALVLKTIGDAMHIRNLILRQLARIELETDDSLRQRLGHFVVIGGGFSGVETAGAIMDCVRGINHYYPRVGGHELQVTLLHALDNLLPELPAALGRAALRSLLARGVQVMTNTSAVEISANHVSLDRGGTLDCATTICTVGTQANALTARLAGIRCERGRIVCARDLAILGVDAAWAIGDCALIVNHANKSDSTEYAPSTAQFAVAQAHRLAANLIARSFGRPTHAFAYRSRGMMATVGHLKGVAQIYGMHFSGFIAWLIWRAYYLSQMPTFGRKLRIWVEWSWGMFFRPDITHFRFTRSHEFLQQDDELE
ncbi:NAD(P)/FAD-dependent oxidoreductase [Pseudolysobacter antarcticus]|uniref:NADH:ubiquinone reductase (non-electrogenic) n=1 Tax=Pseudolysobacter antarcticus TaxID=2511995 RepID=A0A411HIS9_9GAMM|nr:FAD-dependent oxidoreductase [Pseudolysobacter antarcticus]QBB70415.1 NAD(P)/FAD-dependent oxidoreductase [Pseudolysobacter antarcticus]